VWIYLPSEFYPSAQESAELNSDLSWQSQLLEQSAMSKSKPLRARSWLAAWKKKDWMQRLFGRILKPSMASLGVEKWIASLADIPVSHLALQEENWETKTQDISGQKLNDSSQKSNHQSASLKMLAGIYDLDLKKSQMTYKQWVIKLRQACLARKKLVLHTKEKDYSSWPTVIVSDHLCNPTETPQRWKERAKQKKMEGINLHKPLRIVAQELENWPTVVTSDAGVGAIISLSDTYKETSTGSLRKINKNGKDGSLGLARTVKMWPTVRSSSANGPCESEIKNNNPKARLEVEVANWRTPNASDAEGGIMEWRDGKAAKLKLRDHSVHAVKSWATPTARDWRDGNASTDIPTNSILGRQAPRAMNTGRESQITLNPRFTEWLMGWPIGWTQLELAETEWCRWLQLMHGELLRMECISQKIN
jgi:hypothetical protein